ncbi:MBL fold metallo-hydrolase [Desulfosarcina widdelii]|uniref:MBL fold metallo-hydrolase n=1 Tax=Desulfosarcina widdelii TaxID=947919 RepID=A0A5K7Z2S7_9BACT|nr:MBL fold metallo-hydrolase [Desulfosarcina widdelii]BBO75015.1 MBL fold metallo-hydrolase [Desulfosarcina widdelii]
MTVDGSYRIHHLAPRLYQIVLAPPIEGFDNFIAAWLVKGPDAVYLVDVGPAVTVTQLSGALDNLGVAHLDYICLTHIHIDHAGAIGHLARRFAETPVICHPKGAAHIVDPERLWQGTLKMLGDTARAYGRMLPVAPSSIATESDLAAAPFQLLDTPGHSPHHYAIAAADCLFAGEAGGVCLPLASTEPYLRPATPPRFFLETSLASIDRIMAASPQTICYGHFGLQNDGMRMLARHRDQLLFWKKTLGSALNEGNSDLQQDYEGLVDLMLYKDPNLKGFKQLPPEVRGRERGFLLNSVKGFVGYLAHCREKQDA